MCLSKVSECKKYKNLTHETRWLDMDESWFITNLGWNISSGEEVRSFVLELQLFPFDF